MNCIECNRECGRDFYAVDPRTQRKSTGSTKCKDRVWCPTCYEEACRRKATDDYYAYYPLAMARLLARDARRNHHLRR